ncbi:hypothetical protein R3W88_027137 [Solanum pinnatisectum]|uniref:Reverse transcriptase zinc-binding domain-containing protein n=1 Tax=Solanum pinnatisectum TaxID=50273 RepID=A0AAV9LG15_9SOLN|nr:hypothetical protein R3W88_027137 [Solanum pinnatisectum]
MFIIPAKIIKLIEGPCRSYLWSGVVYVTKKALVAWKRVCCPKSAGGMVLINMQLWNKAAVAKLCWDLANNEDKLWIKWIHTYYIKGWMIRKVMSAKHIIDQVQLMQGKKGSMIRQIYLCMIGELERPDWKCLMFNNAARPKAYFTMWIMLNKKLATVDMLAKWGVDVNKTCILCNNAEETIEHPIIQCQFARKLWERLFTWIHQHSVVLMTWGHFIQWCIQQGKGKTKSAQIFKTILAEGVYGLWIERNNIIFVKKSKMEENVAKEIAYVTIARAPASNKNVVNEFKF